MKNEKNEIIFVKLATKILKSLQPLIFLENNLGEKIDILEIEYIGFPCKNFIPQNLENTRLKCIPYNLIRLSAPSIVMIKRILEAIISKVDIYLNTMEKVNITQFRLKLNAWANYPDNLPNHILAHLSSVCNADCVFCYCKGDLFRIPYLTSCEEAKTRIKYLNVEKNLGLPRFENPMGEPFCNPNILDILKMIREKVPDAPIQLTTNGILLNEATICELSKLKPIYLEISVNSLNSEYRCRLMKRKTNDGIWEKILFIKEQSIPFSGSVVAWPSLPLKEIEDIIKLLETTQALYAVIFLPGATKFHKFTGAEIRNLKLHWSVLKNFYLEIKNKFRIPVILIPSSFAITSIRSEIIGVMLNSPAEMAGIKTGDIVTGINDKPVFTSDAFYKIMKKVYNPPYTEEVRMKIQRGTKFLDLVIKDLKNDEYIYPYRPNGYVVEKNFFLGIMMSKTFDLSALNILRNFIHSRNLTRVAVFVSSLVKNQLKEVNKYIKLKDFFKKCEIRFYTMRNFWWGGNIILGDLMMVEDFCKLLKHKRIREFSPEVVAMPTTFLRYGRDYSGKSYKEIERETGYKVFLMPCGMIEF